MGAEADQFEAVGVGFAVDQDEVGADVAVAVVGPVAGQGVVDVAAGEWGVGEQQVNQFGQERSQFFAQGFGFFTAIVALEAARLFSRPHSGLPATRLRIFRRWSVRRGGRPSWLRWFRGWG